MQKCAFFCSIGRRTKTVEELPRFHVSPKFLPKIDSDNWSSTVYIFRQFLEESDNISSLQRFAYSIYNFVLWPWSRCYHCIMPQINPSLTSTLVFTKILPSQRFCMQLCPCFWQMNLCTNINSSYWILFVIFASLQFTRENNHKVDSRQECTMDYVLNSLL